MKQYLATITLTVLYRSNEEDALLDAVDFKDSAADGIYEFSGDVTVTSAYKYEEV